MSCPHVGKHPSLYLSLLMILTDLNDFSSTAGAVALLLSEKRAQNLGPLDVRSIYASTSIGLPTTRGGSTLDSVLVQGGGELPFSPTLSSRKLVTDSSILA